MASISEVGKAIKPLAAKLETLAGDTDTVVKAVRSRAGQGHCFRFRRHVGQTQRRRR